MHVEKGLTWRFLLTFVFLHNLQKKEKKEKIIGNGKVQLSVTVSSFYFFVSTATLVIKTLVYGL